MVVHPGVPATNVREFVALARASPGRINYSSAGHGSSGHLTGELFRARAGIDIVHVNYKGGGQAVQDLLGGQIQMLMTALPTLAFTSATRDPGAPDVRERLTALGTEPTGGTSEQFAETIKADTARWAKVVSDAGIRID